MIVYEISNLWGLRDLPRIHGSALYKSVLPSAFSTLLLVLLEYHSKWQSDSINKEVNEHPYAIGALIAFYSFLLTFRLKFSYNRFWEADSSVDL